MKLEKFEKIATNTAELEITVPADEFEKALDSSYKKNVKNMNIPGFRKGKAPRKMIEKMYGESIFYEDAINMVYPNAYDSAVKEAGIEPVDKADVEVISANAEGFKFKAKVTVKPEITIKDYKGIEIEKEPVEVTEDDVNKEIDSFRHRQSRLISVVDRPSQIGDSVIFDFDGYVDGKAFEGGKAESYTLVLGSGQFIPGFEDQMVGHKPEEEFSVNVKFPETYGEKSLAGKDAEFKIKLHEIKIEQLPEVDDDFVKDISEFDTVDAFTQDIKKKILERKQNQADNAVNEKISVAIAEKVEGEIPDCMYDAEVENNIKNLESKLSAQNITLDQYLQFTGGDLDSMKAMIRQTAITDVKLRLALEKIASEEKIIIEQNEIDDEYKHIADTYKMKPEEIKSDYITESITKDLSIQKAFEAVKAAAQIVAKKEEKKTATKKSTTKKTTTDKKSSDTATKSTTKKTTAKKATKKVTEDSTDAK